ncbi:MAG: histidine kinase [Bacteroidetes bacterium]|jgi:signal transduction histidine kinase|nr:histidine kinase [Bacteroidota bacterium]
MTSITDKELLNELQCRLQRNDSSELMAQLKKVNDKLLASEKLKSNFLSNIRNEINNPVSAILEMAKSLSEKRVPAKSLELISILIYNEIFSLDFQLRNIVISAELEAGIVELSPSKIRINALVKSIISSFSNLIEKKNIEFSFKIDNGDLLFVTDPEKLHLIVSNLISNAVRFCDEKGYVTVEVILVDKELTFKIRNNGKTISKRERAIIFDRFRQIEEGMNKSYAGHGLGLSIVKALTDSLNGEIVLAVNDAVEFTLVLKELRISAVTTESENGNDFIFDNTHDAVF